MPFEFTNVIKGLVTQTLLMALLERGGYRVTRLGIEELFGEIKHIDMSQYLNLSLPLQLRYLPDLLVADVDMKSVFLVEVKFRRKFDQSTAETLHEELRKQREHWPQAYAVIMVAEPFGSDRRFHQDYIRVVNPKEHDCLIDTQLSLAQRWDKLHHLQRVFRKFKSDGSAADVQQAADTLT